MAVGRFNKRSVQMTVSGFGDPGTVLLVVAGMLTGSKAQTGCKLKGDPEALEITIFCQERQGQINGMILQYSIPVFISI